MPTKTKKMGIRGRGQGVEKPAFATASHQKRRHTEIYRFEDDLSLPHPMQPRILRYVSASTGRSEYIDAVIFGEAAEFPKTISITVEW